MTVKKVTSCSAGLLLASISGPIFLSSFLLTNALTLLAFAEPAECWSSGVGCWAGRAQQSELPTALPNPASAAAGDTGDVQVSLRMGLAHGPTITGSDGQGEMSPGWLRSMLQGWQERNVGEHLLFVNWEGLRRKHESTINLEYRRAP